MQDTELLAPAGSFETARAAFAAGADAVYLGLAAFSARAEAVNFTPEELRRLLGLARAQGKKVYVTFNTVIDDADVPEAIERLALLDELQPDGVIVQDLGVARLVRRHFPHLALHASTQLVAHNLEGVLALKELGFTRVVLARELSLEDIRDIVRRSGVEIETFVHGALCYSISGLCLFSALEKNRSGNRGRCAYCCRLGYTDAAGRRALPFSMRDLRLDDALDALRDAGVASLKIEGRMKSPLYVASVTRRYRELLDGTPPSVSRPDLETVFSRRTTGLYLRGYPALRRDPASALDQARAVIDPDSLGHLGTPVGTVKRLTKDRENRTWLRFHTNRALEKHDGLQFAAPSGGKPAGFGIVQMRTALARKPVFDVAADEDVEVLVPEPLLAEIGTGPTPFAHGATVYCSASNEMKRRFPVPSFRPSDVASGRPVDLVVSLAPDRFTAACPAFGVHVEVPVAVSAARDATKTEAAVRACFAKLGDTAWALGTLALEDPAHLFAPASVLNELRRQLVARLDEAAAAARAERIAAAQADAETTFPRPAETPPARVLKIRLEAPVPEDAADFDEIVCALGRLSGAEAESRLAALGAAAPGVPLRLALPVFTLERDFNTLRNAVKHLLRAGWMRWEAADLATLRLVRTLGARDVTADWSLYAFNRPAVACLHELGVARFTCSPENDAANLAALADVTPAPEFLESQSTPLMLSLTRPATEDPARLTGIKGDEYAVFPRDGLWVVTRPAPRRFDPPAGGTVRIDRSWDEA